MTREEAIEKLKTLNYFNVLHKAEPTVIEALNIAIESLSAEKEKENGTFVNRDNCNFNCSDSNRSLVEPKWITDSKPKEEGTYMVTLDAFGLHRFIKLMDYGKPLIPNKEVRGKCWYDSDNEYGDVVYDDTEILAWMPLPTPYGERR